MPDAPRQLASLSHAVLLLGPGQVVAAANPAAEQLLGQSFRRLSGRAQRRSARRMGSDDPRGENVTAKLLPAELKTKYPDWTGNPSNAVRRVYEEP